MDFSIVIPTWNRSHLVDALLQPFLKKEIDMRTVEQR